MIDVPRLPMHAHSNAAAAAEPATRSHHAPSQHGTVRHQIGSKSRASIKLRRSWGLQGARASPAPREASVSYATFTGGCITGRRFSIWHCLSMVAVAS